MILFVFPNKLFAQIVTTIAGNGYTRIDGPARVGDSVATFNTPRALVVDRQGNIYVADYNNNKIRKISTNGIVTTVAGTGVKGTDNGPVSTATLTQPTSVAVDSIGNIYFTENNIHTIRKVSTDGFVSI